VLIGRKSDNPSPTIIFGASSVKANHLQFQILDNGQVQVQITNQEAHSQTLINGKNLNIEEMN